MAACWLIPLTAALWLFYKDPGSINPFRVYFSDERITIERQSTVYEAFGIRPSGGSARQDDEFELNQWIRWMNDGASSTEDHPFVFIASVPFEADYHFIEVELFDFSKQSLPTTGVAFLVHDDPHDDWFRPTYRQVPCRADSDGESRLFRVTVRDPSKHERLYLFIKLEAPPGKNILPPPSSLPFVLRVPS